MHAGLQAHENLLQSPCWHPGSSQLFLSLTLNFSSFCPSRTPSFLFPYNPAILVTCCLGCLSFAILSWSPLPELSVLALLLPCLHSQLQSVCRLQSTTSLPALLNAFGCAFSQNLLFNHTLELSCQFMQCASNLIAQDLRPLPHKAWSNGPSAPRAWSHTYPPPRPQCQEPRTASSRLSPCLLIFAI